MAKNSKELILESAKIVFSEKGFHGSTVDDIIKKAGTGKGTFYNYFDSKTVIFQHILEQFVGNLISEIKALDPRKIVDQDSYTVLSLQSAVIIVRNFTENKQLSRIFFWEAFGLNKDVDTIISNAYSELTNITAALIERGQKIGVIRKLVVPYIAASSVVGMVTHVIKYYMQGEFDKFSLNEILTTVNSLLLSGFLIDNEEKSESLLDLSQFSFSTDTVKSQK